ncbi:MAG: sigma-54-dependent transcriptional regulator [Desulfopila sp.]
MTVLAASHFKIMLVDDEPEVLEGFDLILKYEGFANTLTCQDSRELLALLVRNHDIDAILLDLNMPYLSGQEALPILSEQYPHIPVIMVTASNELEVAVACMRQGAFDYLVKPVEKMALIGSVRRALEKRALIDENMALKNHLIDGELLYPDCFAAIITRNMKMLNLFKYCEAISGSVEPVLITGETGVGKELFARSLHRVSARKGEFVAVNIAGLDETSFSDVLFGHLRGAFSGAEAKREGLVKQAAGGTLFLDEIGDLDLSLQVKLLRLLQEQEYYPLGADFPEKSSVRIIAATNRSMAKEHDNPSFRRDLFYRLQTHHVHIPPLRERREDLPLLVEHFLHQAAGQLKKSVPHYPEEIMTLLGSYHFPGNLRELKSILFDALSQHTTKTMSLAPIREKIFKDAPDTRPSPSHLAEDATLFADFTDLPSLERASYHLVLEAMKRANGNQTIAARFLGISQSALSQRLKKMKPQR